MKTALFIMIVSSSILEIRCDHSESPLEELARITRDVNWLMGYLVYQSSYVDATCVYSGLRLMATLVSMYSAGSPELKEGLENARLPFTGRHILPFSESLKSVVCEYMNMFTNFSGATQGESNLTFKSMLFYRQDMVLKRTIENSCFNNNSQSLNFQDTHGSEETINDWFKQFVNEPYLSRTLPEDTNVLFMNGIHMDIRMSVPYGFSGDIAFTNLYWMSLNVTAMEKTTTMFYGKSQVSRAFMIREDFVGGRFSSVIISFDSVELQNRFKSLISNPDKLTGVLNEAMQMKDEFKMRVILPQLRIETRHDLGVIIEDVIKPNIFSRQDLLSDLTDDDSRIYHLPYGEFINIVPTVSSKVVPVNKTVVIDKSFLFAIMDRKYNLAVQTTYYTGLYSSFFNPGLFVDTNCRYECK